MDISPYYIDARNAITQPDKMVFLSQYFRRCWMPALGPLGTAIVIYLRGACYYNRRSGELRDTVQISQREIAAGCGSSVPTIKRELERNEALRRFVQISPEWERDAAGRVRQMENHYQIAMDDPLTDGDEIRLREMVEERIRQEQVALAGSGGQPRKPIRRKGPGEREQDGLTAGSKAVLTSVRDAASQECSNAVRTACSTGKASESQGSLFLEAGQNGQRNGPRPQSKAPGDQNELLRPGDQFESTPYQNELLYKESLPKTTKEQTLNVKDGINHVDNSREKACAGSSAHRLYSGLDTLRRDEVAKIVEELRDWGSERRHRQLLSICDQHNLSHLPRTALQAVRKRQTSKTKTLDRPGAYYQRILIGLLEDHQVFVPSAAELIEDNPEEVHRMIRQSLEVSD